MESVQYLHCSFAGSYYVDCEVLEKINEDEFKVRYCDPIIDEIVERTTSRSRLKFPDFQDMIL